MGPGIETDTRSPSEGPRSLSFPVPRYQSLDLWRGVACLSVLVSHAVFFADCHGDPSAMGIWDYMVDLLRWGWIGVPIFFVISGYCVAASADTARHGKQSAMNFFWRRFRRIYPPYWALLAFAGVWSIATSLAAGGPAHDKTFDAWPLSPSQWIGNLGLIESWRDQLAGSPRQYLFTHAWTLCYEEQFYVVIGVLCCTGPRHFFLVVGAISAVVVITQHNADWLGISTRGLFIDGLWLTFAAGVLVYYKASYATRVQQFAINSVLAVGCVYYCKGEHHTDLYCAWAFGFALLISVLHPFDLRTASIRIMKPLIICGSMCYSVYLVHWPIVKSVGAGFGSAGVHGPLATLTILIPVSLAISLLAAWAFHVNVERRFLPSASPAVEKPGREETANAPQVAACVHAH